MTRPDTGRFLRLTGAFPLWQSTTLLLVGVLGIAEWAISGRAESSLMSVLILFPVFVGTGLLSSAREGRLDLIIGAGVSRSAILWSAVLRALLLPLFIVLVLVLLTAGGSASGWFSRALRGLAVAALTGGVCFTAGVVQPAYLSGTLWIFIRLVSFLIPAGREYLAQFQVWTYGGAPPPLWKTVIAMAMVPELALDRRIPWPLVAAMPILGGASLLLGARWFRFADLGGKRQE